MRCKHCESENIVFKVPVVDPFWATPVGPKYRKGKGKMVQTATTYIDFCNDCGTVLRTYVDIPDGAKWIHGKNEFANE